MAHRIRPLDPTRADEVDLVATRMRATLVEVVDPVEGHTLYTMDWLRQRVRWHLDPGACDGQVFVAEGIDAHRAVFLLRMYDGTLDSFEESWLGRIEDEGFFDMLLEPAIDFGLVAEEELDRVIEAGYEYGRQSAPAPGRNPSNWAADALSHPAG